MGKGMGSIFSPLLLRLADRAASLSKEEFTALLGVHEDMEHLSFSLALCRAVLEGAEERQELGDLAVRSWLESLRDVAYDVDDMLDDLAAGVDRQQKEAEEQHPTRYPFYCLSSFVSYCFLSCFTTQPIRFRLEIARRIQSIRKSLDAIEDECKRLGLLIRGTNRPREITTGPEAISSPGVEVIGRHAEINGIVEMLLRPGDDSFEWGPYKRDVFMVSIVGMGGIGKTTVAQAVYNDRRIEEHFLLKIWAFVGGKFDARSLMGKILDEPRPHEVPLTELHTNLVKKLQGNRFLIVLDDVWSERTEEWDLLWPPLTYAASGSRVLVTTRGKNVAKTIVVLPTCRLNVLPDDVCWSIFGRFAFNRGYCPPNLMEIGKKIVKKQKGIPLAARLVGEFLSNKLDESVWRSFLVDDILSIRIYKHNIMRVLRSSYQNLPAHLKQCFAYTSLFPKGWPFDKTMLIQMWMAQGLIQPQTYIRIEATGSDYFDDLVCRSFFESDGKGRYSMHDLIHDLALSISEDEICRTRESWSWLHPENVRHLSFSNDGPEPLKLEVLYKFKKVRTILHFKSCSSFNIIPYELFLQLRYMRVLDLSCSDVQELPDSVSELKYLRYLDLSNTEIQKLPDSLCLLNNLQTLRLGEFSECLSELPNGMSNLVGLRCLTAPTLLVSKIAGIGKLTSLQELKAFNVFREIGFKIGELKSMKELRGGLSIRNLQNIESEEEAEQASLKDKKFLAELELVWGSDFDSNLRNHEEVLEGLQPHPNLEILKISHNYGVWSPSWMQNGLLSNLRSICLNGCSRWELLPPFGQLPFLKYLRIKGMNGVKHVGSEFYGYGKYDCFRSLEMLEFEEMLVWETWVQVEELDGRCFPSLRSLTIRSCPELRELPHIPPTLTELEISNVALKVLPELWSCDDRMIQKNNNSSLP